MESCYDEDLSKNYFFQILQQDYPQIFERAIVEGWIICVPRCGSFDKSILTEQDFLGHILIPNIEVPGTHFQSLTDREVRLNNRCLTVEDNTDRTSCFSLLFEETHYSDDFYKYSIWCIDGLLEQSGHDLPQQSSTVTSLQNSIDLIKSEISDNNILKELDLAIEEFESTHKNLDNEPLENQKDIVGCLYSKCLKILLKDSKVKVKTDESKYYLQSIKIAVETYMLNGLKRLLNLSITNYTAVEDSNLNKIIKNLSDLQFYELEIRKDLCDKILRGKLELSRINAYQTVLGKINCLRKVVKFISEGELNVSSDELLPIFIFLVIKAGLSNWMYQIKFMKLFRYSVDSINEADEVGFLITSLEAAVEHVKSGMIVENFKLSVCNKRSKTEDTEVTDAKMKDKPLLPLDILFDNIKRGNIYKVKNMLLKECEVIGSTNMEKIKNSLCHPLCLCEKCQNNLSNNYYSQSLCISSRDERGVSPLHIACLYNKIDIVKFLLENNANPNDVDDEGKTSLHHASGRGYQEALLLLLQANVDPNIADLHGNTALHVMSDHGHENCVKTLLHFAKQSDYVINVNALNLHGETALYFASKWGYSQIVKLLLESGADPSIKNKRNQTSLSIAHNKHIVKLLKATLVSSNRPAGICESNTQRQSPRTQMNGKIKTNSEKKIRFYDGLHKIDRLFTAVAEGDVWLASYYLGLEGPRSNQSGDKEEPESKTNIFQLCHPLCNCEKCVSIEEIVFEKETKPPVAINAVNGKGETALHIASTVGCTKIIEILLDAGAKVNLATRSEGRTPLHLACINNRINVVKMLLNCGECNIDVKDHCRDTPLHLSARAGHVRIVELLVRQGANTKIVNINGFTPCEEIERISTDDIFLSLALSNVIKILKNNHINDDP